MFDENGKQEANLILPDVMGVDFISQSQIPYKKINFIELSIKKEGHKKLLKLLIRDLSLLNHFIGKEKNSETRK